MLIGMISMTVFATTSEPVQKSKPIIEQYDQAIVSVDMVNVAVSPFVLTEVSPAIVSHLADPFCLQIGVESLVLSKDVGSPTSELTIKNSTLKNQLSKQAISKRLPDKMALPE